MERGMEHEVEKTESPKGTLLLVTIFLIGPVMWIIDLVTRYALSDRACANPGWMWGLHISSIVAFVIVVVMGLIGLRHWREADYRWPSDLEPPEVNRTNMLVAVGVMICGLFALAIIAQAIPTFIVTPCAY